MTFAHVEQAWIFAVDGTLVTTLHKPSSFDASVLHKGVYLVKMKNKNIVRVEKVTIKQAYCSLYKHRVVFAFTLLSSVWKRQGDFFSDNGLPYMFMNS